MWGSKTLNCPKGHVFDLSRSGYCNLLQPQDKRSRRPGDCAAAVAARRRTWQRGLGNPLRDELIRCIRGKGLPSQAVVLDVGCGDGFFLDQVAGCFGCEGWGVDISVAAVDACAKAYPRWRWVAANADRRLPFASMCFDLILSITSRRNVTEFERLLRPGGWLVLVVPAEEDLWQLREAVLGKALRRDRVACAADALRPVFELQRQQHVQSTHLLDVDALKDLLAGTYRGERMAERRRFSEVTSLEVTMAYQVLEFRATLQVADQA